MCPMTVKSYEMGLREQIRNLQSRSLNSVALILGLFPDA